MQYADSELSKGERVQATFDAAQFWWKRFDNRSQLVWKLHISLWTVLAALIGIIITGELRIDTWSLKGPIVGFALLLLFLHINYIRKQAEGSKLDRDRFHEYYDNFQELIDFSYNSGLTNDIRKMRAKSGTLLHYAHSFSWLVTLLLVGSLIVATIAFDKVDSNQLTGESALSSALTLSARDTVLVKQHFIAAKDSQELGVLSHDALSGDEENLTVSWFDFDPVFTWESIASIALIITLFLVIRYTQSTRAMADYMKKEVDFLKAPLLSIACKDPRRFGFPTVVWNPSMVHAKVRVKAIIVVNDDELKMPPNHHYKGDRTWQVQAVGNSGISFGGHLSLDSVLAYNDIDPDSLDKSTVTATVTIDSWSASLSSPDEELAMESSQNPRQQWVWSREHQVWIQEIAPEA